MAANEYRSRRLDCGLTQDDLAELAGVSTSTVRNVEMGRVRKPRVRERIDRALLDFESGESVTPTRPHCGPALLYVDMSGHSHEVDAEDFELSALSARDQTLYRALLAYATKTAEGGAA